MPTVVVSPGSLTTPAGSKVVFTVQAKGSAPLSFAWKRIGTNAGPVSGCGNSSTCTISSVGASDAGRYTVEIKNPAGAISAKAATLTVVSTIENAYYVNSATGVDSSQAGTLQKPWKTLNYAVSAGSSVPEGSTIYVKAGVYKESGVTIQKSNISIIGYTSVPGDSPAVGVNQKDPVAFVSNGQHGASPAIAAQMPLLKGSSREIDSTGIYFDANRNIHNVTIKNIGITQYLRGVRSGSASNTFSESIVLDNVNVYEVGRTDGEYGGLGISLGSMSTAFSNGSKVLNSLVVNSSSEGITITGNNNLLENSSVYGLETVGSASTDYYVMVTGNTNVVTNNYIERDPNSSHSGHGYSIKDNSWNVIDEPLSGVVPVYPTGNWFENNMAVNLGEGYVVRHRGVHGNTFVNNSSVGNYTGGEPCMDGNGITIRDGAHDNVFINTTVKNVCEAVTFGDTVEDGDYGMSNPPGHPGNGNVIDGIHVDTAYLGLSFYKNEETVDSDAGANVIKNSSFKNVSYMFMTNRHSNHMSYSNTSFSGVGNGNGFVRGDNPADIVISQFTNCTFSNFKGMPKGFK